MSDDTPTLRTALLAPYDDEPFPTMTTRPSLKLELVTLAV